MTRKIVSAITALAMLALMAYSGARLWAIDEEIKAERRLHIELLQHKPEPVPGDLADPLAGLREQNPDIVGWIAVPFTNIDYPIVQAKDNDYYLRRDLNGDYAKPGTVFMDYRCAKDGSGYSIVYGHNMKSGSMFGTLGRFEEKAFFDAHQEGRILFEDGWHTLRFFAFLIVRENNSAVYALPQSPDLRSGLALRAKHYREFDAAETGRLVALSTCSYAYQGARMVLIGEIMQKAEDFLC